MTCWDGREPNDKVHALGALGIAFKTNVTAHSPATPG